jgi:hypothetical protein
MIRYAEKLQIVPLFQPQASTVVDLETAHMKIKNAQWISFLCIWSSLTSDSTDLVNVMVYTSTAATTTSAVAQPFKYRLSSAVGDDLWGTITSATAAAGVNITATDDNKLLLIDVDPAPLLALDSDAEYAHLLINGVGAVTNPTFGVVGFMEPRYPQNLNLTSS